MNNALKVLLITLVGVAVMVGVATYTAKGVAVSVVQQIQESGAKNLGSVDLNRFVKAPTNTIASCGQTSGLLVATSTSRLYLALVNDGTSTIYLALGKTAIGSNGIRLNGSGGTFEMGSEAMFTGAINCISSSTGAVTVVEANLAN